MSERIDTAALRALLTDATPGEWEPDPAPRFGPSLVRGPVLEVLAEVYGEHTANAHANARLVALAPALAAEVLALREQLGRATMDAVMVATVAERLAVVSYLTIIAPKTYDPEGTRALLEAADAIDANRHRETP